MIEYKLKPVTETSWILHDHGTRLAIIVASDSKFKSLGRIEPKEFDSFEELGKLLNAVITVEDVSVDDEPTVGDIDGYPVKHSTVHDVVTDRYPSYAKTQGSKTRFAAGYYGVNFSHGWVYSYCPKVNTLEENAWIGPFRTKLEMQNAITQQKNAPRV
jgi:hypothetical protein